MYNVGASESQVNPANLLIIALINDAVWHMQGCDYKSGSRSWDFAPDNMEKKIINFGGWRLTFEIHSASAYISTEMDQINYWWVKVKLHIRDKLISN